MHRCLKPRWSSKTKGNTLTLMIGTFASWSWLNNRFFTLETSLLMSVNIKSFYASFSKSRQFHGHTGRVYLRITLRKTERCCLWVTAATENSGFGQGVAKGFYDFLKVDPGEICQTIILSALSLNFEWRVRSQWIAQVCIFLFIISFTEQYWGPDPHLADMNPLATLPTGSHGWGSNRLSSRFCLSSTLLRNRQR